MNNPNIGKKTRIRIYANDLLGLRFSPKMVMMISAYIKIIGIQYHCTMKSHMECQVVNLLLISLLCDFALDCFLICASAFEERPRARQMPLKNRYTLLEYVIPNLHQLKKFQSVAKN